MSFTITETGKVLSETEQGISMPADYSFATVNSFVHGIDVHFEDLVNLCLGMADHIDKMKVNMGTYLDLDDVVAGNTLAMKELAELRKENSELADEIRRLKRGEFICSKCGLRKDSERREGYDF